MSTKEEKLAAARKKLKEFQCRNKETDTKKEPEGQRNGPKQYYDSGSGRDKVTLSSSSTPIFEDDSNKQYHSMSPQVLQHAQNMEPKISSFFEKSIPIAHFLDELPLNQSHNFSSIPYLNSNSQVSPFETLSDIIQSRTPSNPSFKCDDGEMRQSETKFLQSDANRDDKHGSPPSRPPSGSDMSCVSHKQFFEEPRSTPNSESGLTDVLRPLQAQLQTHVQTISLLVTERNELQAGLKRAEVTIQEKSADMEEMCQRLKGADERSRDGEARLGQCEEALRASQQEVQRLIIQAEAARTEERSWREAHEEMRERLEAKARECEMLSGSVKELEMAASLARVTIQQLSTGDVNTTGPQVFELQGENKRLVQRSLDLEKQLHQAVMDKEQSSQNFQVYAQQCNAQISSLKKQMEHLIVENQDLREKSMALKKTLDEQNAQLKNETVAQKYENELAALRNTIASLTAASQDLQATIDTKDEDLEAVMARLKERDAELDDYVKSLREVQENNKALEAELTEMEMNGSERLLAAMESDKVAAARAVSQNVKLKDQLAELEQGFIRVSDEKLALAEKLAHEEHVNKELQHRIEELEMGLKHDHHSHDHDHGHDHSHGEEGSCSGHDHNKPAVIEEDREQLNNIIRQLQADKAELLSRLNARSASRSSEREETEADSSDRVRQMEDKVRRTMNEIAVLDEEKQKLEHLVLQLQGETETIGEYVSLYQKQRMLLRQRTKEKDEQLIQLSQDREELRAKLASLDDLVQCLLQEKASLTSPPVVDVVTPSSEAEDRTTPLPTHNTAGKIRALITEIGSSSLVNAHSVAFEHCPCCSGRLITI